MTYSKTTWVDNTTPYIDAVALNKMEQGIADADPTARPVITRNVLATGISGQTRAGRQLTVADFTSMGLGTPVGLFNLSGLTNLGTGGALVNKGSVAFVPGITGAASEAAQFNGSGAQALYIVDTGAADPFRITTGSFGCWFKTAKRGTSQEIFAKASSASGNYGWFLAQSINSNNSVYAIVSTTGSDTPIVYGSSETGDGRWHFAVATHDASSFRLYVDGALEAVLAVAVPAFAANGPLNIGGFGGDATTATGNPVFGSVDEAFVTADVLTPDQVRLLYAVRVPHTLSVIPRGSVTTVGRRRRGSALASADFPTAPLRLYNLAPVASVAASATDLGSNATDLTGYSFTARVPGPDGLTNTGVYLNGTSDYLPASDTGLPAGTASRSMGIWFKGVRSSGQETLIEYGAAAEFRLYISNSTNGGALSFYDGVTPTAQPTLGVLDGQWHHGVVTADNAPLDGVKIKVYLDGALVFGVTTWSGTTLAGAGGFRIGRVTGAGAEYFSGCLSRGFVTDYVLTPEQIVSLYAKSSQQLVPSPKSAGHHVEGLDATYAYVIADTLEPQDILNVGVIV